jgi:hypothetical protein
MDLLGCGITTLNLTQSLTLMISTLKSFLISTLVFPFKKKKKHGWDFQHHPMKR